MTNSIDDNYLAPEELLEVSILLGELNDLKFSHIGVTVAIADSNGEPPGIIAQRGDALAYVPNGNLR